METRLAIIKDSIISEPWAFEQLIGKRVTVLEEINQDSIMFAVCKFAINKETRTELIPVAHIEYVEEVTEEEAIEHVEALGEKDGKSIISKLASSRSSNRKKSGNKAGQDTATS